MVETTFPITASMSLDPISLNGQKKARNIYVVAPGKEENESSIQKMQNEITRNQYIKDEQG